MLFEHGDAELAVKLLTADHLTSFEGMRRAGSTTIWEYWPEESGDRSHNHPMFGAVTAHLYDYLLGIRQDEGDAGYNKVVIRPQFVPQLNHVSGSRMLPCGKISVSYVKAGSAVDLTISIPEGLDASFEFNGSRDVLTAGEHRFALTL